MKKDEIYNINFDVNAYYDNNVFYILTYALSNKIKHIECNPNVAIAGEWFT